MPLLVYWKGKYLCFSFLLPTVYKDLLSFQAVLPGSLEQLDAGGGSSLCCGDSGVGSSRMAAPPAVLTMLQCLILGHTDLLIW